MGSFHRGKRCNCSWRRWALQPAGWGLYSRYRQNSQPAGLTTKGKRPGVPSSPTPNPKSIIPDCSGWPLASQTLHRKIWKFRGRRPLPVSACPRRHQRAVANTLRRRTVRQHGLPKRCKPGKGAGSLRGGSGTVLRVLGLVGYQPSLLE